MKIINSLHKNLKYIAIIIVISVFVISGCRFVYKYIYEDETYESNEIVNDITDDYLENDNAVNVSDSKKIIIYITGSILNPGVYELNENSRIIDAVNIAGGATDDADLIKINLAYLLSDGEKIIIPSINNENNGNNYNIDENGIEINNESKSEKININTATISDLIKINGIGESTAKKIIEYRNSIGKFNNIEDLKNISGIGENKYNLIKDYIKAK